MSARLVTGASSVSIVRRITSRSRANASRIGARKTLNVVKPLSIRTTLLS
jgi:hypothetical protein